MSDSRPRKRGREGKDVPFDIESLNKFLGSEEELLRNKAKVVVPPAAPPSPSSAPRASTAREKGRQETYIW